MTDAPLAGLRVLSLAEQYPGPYATLLMADMGADVVLIERPGSGDPSRQFGPFFESLNRNKRSVAVNLKHGDGRQVLLDLCRGADVLLEGFRPGTMERLGLGYAQVAATQPRIVYLSLSGFGQDGPYRNRPAHDVSYQAVAGWLAGWSGEPPGAAPSPHLGDLSAGMFAVIGVLAALHHREQTGRGSYVDLSMTDGLVSMLTAHLVPVINDLGPPAFPTEPGYGVFRTADGQRLALSVAHEDRFWAALCQVLGLGELSELRSAERVERREELARSLGERIASMEGADLDTRLAEHDVPFSWVNGLQDVPADPQIAARGMIVDVPGGDGARARRHVRQPLRFDATAPGPVRPAPAIGEHSGEVLAEAGYDTTVISRLVEDGTVALGEQEGNGGNDSEARS